MKEQREDGELFGYLINIHQESTLGFILQKILRISDRHWVSVRRIGDSYYFMNSKEDRENIVACRK